MSFQPNLATIFLAFFLAGCATNPSETSMQRIAILHVSKEEHSAIVTTDRPVLTISKEKSDLFLSSWSPSSKDIASQYKISPTLQNATLQAVGIWTLLNNSSCANITLREIKPLQLGKSTPSTTNLGEVEIHSTQYSEIWTVVSCDKIQNWQIADNNGKHVMYPLQ